MEHLWVFFTSALLYASLLPGDCITGGKEAKAHSRPYMASLQLGGKHQCGGFLISNQWLMSAAHCFQDDTSFKVVLGAHALSEAEDTKQTFDISTYYQHPDFNTNNYDNDIVLVKLSQPVTETAAVKPVKFQQASEKDPETDAEVDTAGWGANSWGKRLDKLQELTIPILPRWRCNAYGVAFTDNMFCAVKPRMDTCDGDSGGPLLYNGVVVGITSNGGRSCGSTRKPGLYTIISHYSSWITSTMTQ